LSPADPVTDLPRVLTGGIGVQVRRDAIDDGFVFVEMLVLMTTDDALRPCVFRSVQTKLALLSNRDAHRLLGFWFRDRCLWFDRRYLDRRRLNRRLDGWLDGWLDWWLNRWLDWWFD